MQSFLLSKMGSELFTFIQIGPGHPVTHRDAVNSNLKHHLVPNNWQGPIFKERIRCMMGDESTSCTLTIGDTLF